MITNGGEFLINKKSRVSIIFSLSVRFSFPPNSPGNAGGSESFFRSLAFFSFSFFFFFFFLSLVPLQILNFLGKKAFFRESLACTSCSPRLSTVFLFFKLVQGVLCVNC